MVKQGKHDQLSTKITLIYSNRAKEEAAFLKDLDAVNIFTQKEGHLTWAKIKKNVDLEAKPMFYLAGPPGFVQSLKKVLKDHKIPEQNIRSEEFSGY